MKTTNTFRDEELVLMSHWDKQANAYVNTPYPKISGRLRLAHEGNDQLSIITQAIRYDENLAVVAATTTTDKGTFNGVGMASMERDKRIAPAILELAESRAIARSLRFAGYGVEFCSAEEISHLENGFNGTPQQKSNAPLPDRPDNGHPPIPMEHKTPAGDMGGRGTVSTPTPNNGGNGANGNGRLTSRQLNFILKLASERGTTRKELNEHCIAAFGTAVDYLSKYDASCLINEFNS